MSADKGISPTGPFVLFGLLFLLLGLGVASWGARSWVLYAQSGSWQRVPATVKEAKLVEDWSSKSITYTVQATYEYSINGQTYTGHRVSIVDASSFNSYSLNRRRYDELDAARRDGKPVTALVNPKDPSEAILYRERETWLLVMIPVGLLFAGAGAVVIAFGIVAGRTTKRLADIAAHDGNRLWDARRDWAEGHVRASNLMDLLFYWVLGVGLSVFCSIFVVMVAKDDASLAAKAAVGLFCLVAAFMLFKAAKLTIGQIVHGTPVLYLGEVPIVQGRSVLGAVRTQKAISAENWNIQLKCYVPARDSKAPSEERERVSQVTDRLARLGGDEQPSRSSDWRGTCAFSRQVQPAGEPAMDHAGRTMLPVSIEVPATAPGTSLDPSFSVKWVLEVKARSFPVSFDAIFDLPVFYAEPAEIRRNTGNEQGEHRGKTSKT